jgi:hypothetical protein
MRKLAKFVLGSSILSTVCGMRESMEKLGTGFVALLMCIPLAFPAYLLYSITVGPVVDDLRSSQDSVPVVAADYPDPEPTQPAYVEQPEPEAQSWSCGYSPTYNDDWHDDVLCTNGVDQERPYLLQGDSFVEEHEIMDAAARYEEMLNSR